MSKPTGKCVWCGESGLTKGHVWADWINRLMSFSNNHEHIHTQESFSTRAAESKPETRSPKQGSALARKPRNTCGRCNNGWMSEIENSAIVVATPLILGQQCLLGVFARWRLASLLCLI